MDPQELKRLSDIEQRLEIVEHLLNIHQGPISPIIPLKRKYTQRPDLPDQRDFKYTVKQPKLPISVDLTAVQSPVEDQLTLGSCVDNAEAAILEALMIKDKKPVVRLSRLFMYYNARALEGTVNSDSGSTIRDALKATAKLGVCPESEWPYNINQYTVKPPTKCYTDALKDVIVTYTRLNTLTDLKDCLASGFPYIMGITVYESFEQVGSNGIVPMPKPHEKVLGGHGICGVAYNDTTKLLKFKNSWGAGWGDHGFGYLPYSYINYISDMWMVTSDKGF